MHIKLKGPRTNLELQKLHVIKTDKSVMYVKVTAM